MTPETLNLTSRIVCEVPGVSVSTRSVSLESVILDHIAATSAVTLRVELVSEIDLEEVP